VPKIYSLFNSFLTLIRFKEKLGEGTHRTVFKGKLSSEILVAVKILNNSRGEGKKFITEVEFMGKIHHINVICFLGFCVEGIHRALVYNLFPIGFHQITRTISWGGISYYKLALV